MLEMRICALVLLSFLAALPAIAAESCSTDAAVAKADAAADHWGHQVRGAQDALAAEKLYWKRWCGNRAGCGAR